MSAPGKTNAALLILDVRVGMFDGFVVPPVYEGDRPLARIAGLVEVARTAGVPVIYAWHLGGAGHPVERGTGGCEIHPAVAPPDGEPVIEKATPNPFYGTMFREELEPRSVGRLVVAAVSTEYCVDTACRRTFGNGDDVKLVEDAHDTRDTDLLSAPRIRAHHNELLGGWCAGAVGSDEVRMRKLAPRA